MIIMEESIINLTQGAFTRLNKQPYLRAACKLSHD